jgi:site-specific recombinase XerD
VIVRKKQTVFRWNTQLNSIEQFVSDVCAGKRNETPSAYKSKLTRLVKWMDASHLSICNLTMSDVERFRQSLFDQHTIKRGHRSVEGHLSPFTIYTVMRTVKHYLGWSYTKGYINFDPGPLVIKPPPQPDPKPITPENVLALLHTAARFGDAWEQARNLAIIYTLRDTAGRISAILTADMDGLDLAKGRMDVREKGDKKHTLYLNTPAATAIRAWLKHRPDLEPKDNALFLSQKGTALKRSGWYSTLLRLKQAAGLNGMGRVNAHAFRHAWARDALSSGLDLTRVSSVMNHSTTRTTSDYYARWDDKELKHAHEQYSPGSDLPIIAPIEANN